MRPASKQETLFRRRPIALSFCCFCLIISIPSARLWGRAASDAALRDRVLQLVDRLDAPTKQAQDAAQASLIKLGPKILALLPDAADAKTPERKEPSREGSRGPQGHEPDITTAATKVTIKAKGIRLSEALQQLQKQSGNAITDMREQLGAEVTNPALDLDIADKTFFEALDEIARLAEVTTTFATGDGTIGIMAGGSMDAAPGTPAPKPPKPMVQYTGPFRIELKQLSRESRFRDRRRDRQRSARSRLGAAAPAHALEAQLREPQDHRRPEERGRAAGQQRNPTRSSSGPRIRQPRSISTSLPPSATPRSWPRSR